MKIRLPKLQNNNKKSEKLKSERLPEGWEDIKEMFYYKSLLYIPKIICSKIISRHYDNPLISHFGIKKTQELIARKYYWLTLQKDIEVYIKSCNICLVSKAVHYKLYKNFQLLPILTHQ